MGISSASQDDSTAADANTAPTPQDESNARHTPDEASTAAAQVSPNVSSGSATPQGEALPATGKLPATKATEVPDQVKRKNSKERAGADMQMRSKLEKRRSKVEGTGRK